MRHKKKIMGSLGALVVALAISPYPGRMTNSFSYESETVVFTSDHDKVLPQWLKEITFPDNGAWIKDVYMFTPITIRQNLRGNHVTWISGPTREEVLEELSNDAYESVVFVGYGSHHLFRVADGRLDTGDVLKEIDKGTITRKSGEFIQHTSGNPVLPVSFYQAKCDKNPWYCAQGKHLNFSEVLLTHPNKGYGFYSNIWPTTNWARAWVELFRPFTHKGDETARKRRDNLLQLYHQYK